MCVLALRITYLKKKKKKKGLSKGIRRPKEFLAIGVGASYMKTLEV